MLQHDDLASDSAQPAALRRVTPQELAAAIARLEARQEAESDGTIPLGKAVEELGLAASPEALWAEVRAARAARYAPRRASPSRRRNILLSAAFVAAGGGLVGWQAASHPPPGSKTAQAADATALTVDDPQPISVKPDLLVQDVTGKIVTLPEARDGQPVRCFLSSERPRSFAAFTPGMDAGYLWTLTRHGGQTYVRGFIPRMSLRALELSGADVINHPDGLQATHPLAVWLPLAGFQVTPDAQIDGRSFHAQNIHLDRYAWAAR